MDPDSGRIYSPDEQEKLAQEDKKRLVDIPPEELPDITKMNRHERRKWAAKRRKFLKAAKKPC